MKILWVFLIAFALGLGGDFLPIFLAGLGWQLRDIFTEAPTAPATDAALRTVRLERRPHRA